MQEAKLFNDFHHPHTLKLANSLENTIAGPNMAARFNPYEFNAGTVAAVAGKDCLIIAADTRVSRG